MEKKIIYIHGFNSAPGRKTQALNLEFPGQVISPSLENSPLEDLSKIKEIIDSKDNVEYHIIGTSLGAFYTMYLSTQYSFKDNINYYPINPSLTPHLSLKRYDNLEIQNYKTGKRFKVNSQFLQDLKMIYEEMKSSYDSSILHVSDFFIGTEDCTLNSSDLISFLQGIGSPYRLDMYMQGHRFEDISPVVERVKINSNIFI